MIDDFRANPRARGLQDLDPAHQVEHLLDVALSAQAGLRAQASSLVRAIEEPLLFGGADARVVLVASGLEAILVRAHAAMLETMGIGLPIVLCLEGEGADAVVFDIADVVVAVDASCENRFVIETAMRAMTAEAHVVALACRPSGSLFDTRASSTAVYLKPACAPAVSGLPFTTTSLITTALETILTGYALRMGRIFGGHLVTAERCATNPDAAAAILRDIVEHGANRHKIDPDTLLSEAGGDLATAIVMAETDAGREDAATVLAESLGNVEEAIRRIVS